MFQLNNLYKLSENLTLRRHFKIKSVDKTRDFTELSKILILIPFFLISLQVSTYYSMTKCLNFLTLTLSEGIRESLQVWIIFREFFTAIKLFICS